MLTFSNKSGIKATNVGLRPSEGNVSQGMLQKHNDPSETRSHNSAAKQDEPSNREPVADTFGLWVRQAMTDSWAVGSGLVTWWCQSTRAAADPGEWHRRNPKLVCRLAELSMHTVNQNIALALNLQGKGAGCLMSFGKSGSSAGACDEVRSLLRVWGVQWMSAWSQTAATWADYWLLPPSPQSNDVC
jgi:hypothetical protein